MKNNRYFNYILDLLSPTGNIKTRKMFGGYGFYKNGIFFALISDDILYFKVDNHNQSAYEAHDSKPFTYEGKNKKIITLSYWAVPADILEDHNQLTLWVNQAVAAAQRAKATRKNI